MATKRTTVQPGLHIPVGGNEDAQAFFQAVKERLELVTGDSGNPLARNVTVEDLQKAGLVKATIKNRFAHVASGIEPAKPTDTSTILDKFTNLFEISSQQLQPSQELLIYDAGSRSYRRIRVDNFLQSQNITVDTIIGAPADLGFVNNDPSTNPDEGRWILRADIDKWSILTQSADGTTNVNILDLVRGGTSVTSVDWTADNMTLNGSDILSAGYLASTAEILLDYSVHKELTATVGAIAATKITYDSSASPHTVHEGLTATTVQEAIDQLAAMFSVDAPPPPSGTAATTSFDPTISVHTVHEGLTALNVQDAIDQLAALINNMVLTGGGGGGGSVNSVNSGTGISVDNTDPANPIVNLSVGPIASLALADTAVQPAALLAGNIAYSPGSSVHAVHEGLSAANVQDAIDELASIFGSVSVDYTNVSGLATVAHTGAYADLTGAPSLATVATTGAYADLTGKPTIPSSAHEISYDPNSSVHSVHEGLTATNAQDAIDQLAEIFGMVVASAAMTPAALTKVDDTNVTLTLGGSPATALLQAASITAGWTGTLAVSRGGTGAGTLTGYVKGNGTGAFTAAAGIPYSDLTGTPVIPTSAHQISYDPNSSVHSVHEGLTATNAQDAIDQLAEIFGMVVASGGGGGSSVGANPSASVGLAAVNGSALTFLRSDGAPALDQSIAPTWTGAHTFTNAAGVIVSNTEPYFFVRETGLSANEKVWGWESHNKHMYLASYTDAYGSRNTILDVTRGTGTALVDLSFGNATDNPSFTFLGNGASSFAGTMAISAPAGGSPLTITPAAGERGIEVTGATAAGSSLYLRNTSGSDGRCVVAYSADLTTFQTYLLGIDTTGSNVKNFELRNVTGGTKPFVCTVNGEFTLDTPTSGNTLTVNALATKTGVVINPGNSSSVGLQVTDPGAAGVLARLATTNASAILTSVNGDLRFNVGASTIFAASSSGFEFGTTTDTTLTRARAGVVAVEGVALGFLESTPVTHNAAYTCVLADSGKTMLHTDGTARTYTIPANSSVAYALGTTLTFVNDASGAVDVTIAITTDTLEMAGTGSTGSRTLGRYGIATALKITSTKWLINGTGLT